jgi:hypothetical protein
MASTAIDPTARNSDCQFWSVVSQKSAVPRYWSQPSVDSSWSSASSLKTRQPVSEWASQEPSQIVPITSRSEFEYSHSLSPRARAHLGDRSSACSPTF